MLEIFLIRVKWDKNEVFIVKTVLNSEWRTDKRLRRRNPLNHKITDHFVLMFANKHLIYCLAEELIAEYSDVR